MLENYMVNGIQISRYAATFAIVARHDGGLLYNEDCFKAWLKSLGFTDEQTYDCWTIAMCDSYELKKALKNFSKNIRTNILAKDVRGLTSSSIFSRR